MHQILFTHSHTTVSHPLQKNNEKKVGQGANSFKWLRIFIQKYFVCSISKQKMETTVQNLIIHVHSSFQHAYTFSYFVIMCVQLKCYLGVIFLSPVIKYVLDIYILHTTTPHPYSLFALKKKKGRQREIDRWMDRQIDSLIDKQIDRQINRQIQR